MSPWGNRPKKKDAPAAVSISGGTAQASTSNDPVKVETTSSAQPMVITSHTNAYIHDRLKGGPQSWGDVSVKPIDDDRDDKWHVLVLPKDVEDVFRKRNITPRWVNKREQSISRALDVRGWHIVNRVLFPELKSHLFTANGTIERGDAILCFMPKERADILRAEPGKRSTERVKNLPIDKWKNDKGGDKYYKPRLSEERDGETFREGVQPDVASAN